MSKIAVFEEEILNIYAQLYGRTDKDGNRQQQTVNEQEAFEQAQAAYDTLTDGHEADEEALLVTDELSHEAVTVMYDLGVNLNQGDPLFEKMWFWEFNAMDDDLGTKYTNPYYHSFDDMTELVVKNLIVTCKKFTRKGIIKPSAIKARNQRIGMVVA